MSPTAVVIMVSTSIFIWGGFLALVVRAIRREGAKRGDASRR